MDYELSDRCDDCMGCRLLINLDRGAMQGLADLKENAGRLPDAGSGAVAWVKITRRLPNGSKTGGFRTAFKVHAVTTAVARTSIVAARRTFSTSLETIPRKLNLGKVDQTWFLDLALLPGWEVRQAKSSRVAGAAEGDLVAQAEGA